MHFFTLQGDLGQTGSVGAPGHAGQQVKETSLYQFSIRELYTSYRNGRRIMPEKDSAAIASVSFYAKHLRQYQRKFLSCFNVVQSEIQAVFIVSEINTYFIQLELTRNFFWYNALLPLQGSGGELGEAGAIGPPGDLVSVVIDACWFFFVKHSTSM